MKRIMTLGLILLFAFCSSACASGKSAEPAEISATALWSEFASDIDAASAEYDGCLLAVTGSIAEIADSFMGEPCILLENGADTIPDGIFCFFNEDANFAGLNCGDTITVLGTCSVAQHIAGDATPFISIENASLG